MFNREIKNLEEEYMLGNYIYIMYSNFNLEISRQRNDISLRNQMNTSFTFLKNDTEGFMKVIIYIYSYFIQKYDQLKSQILQELDEILKTIITECISMQRNRSYVNESGIEDFIFKQVDIKVTITI